MTGGHHDKICPILAASGTKDNVSTGSSWATRCKSDECGWWDPERESCAVTVISQELRELFSSGAIPKPA